MSKQFGHKLVLVSYCENSYDLVVWDTSSGITQVHMHEHISLDITCS